LLIASAPVFAHDDHGEFHEDLNAEHGEGYEELQLQRSPIIGRGDRIGDLLDEAMPDEERVSLDDIRGPRTSPAA
jgi:hypothetical protein